MPRKYQKVQKSLPEIKQMLEKGMGQREVAERLRLAGDRPIHALLKRERCGSCPNSEDENPPGIYRDTSMKTSA